MLTLKRLKELLIYDTHTWLFTWISYTNPANQYLVGKTAGHKSKQGYVRIAIDDKLYLAHRLAWLYMAGEWPVDIIDHIDRIKSNNVFDNLRESNKSLNALNWAPDRYKNGPRTW